MKLVHQNVCEQHMQNCWPSFAPFYPIEFYQQNFLMKKNLILNSMQIFEEIYFL